MKKVYRIETFDGQLHLDIAAATKHLNFLNAYELAKVYCDIIKDRDSYGITNEDLEKYAEQNKDYYIERFKIQEDFNFLGENGDQT